MSVDAIAHFHTNPYGHPFMGVLKDLERHSLEQRIAKVVSEELRKALQVYQFV